MLDTGTSSAHQHALRHCSVLSSPVCPHRVTSSHTVVWCAFHFSCLGQSLHFLGWERSSVGVVIGNTGSQPHRDHAALGRDKVLPFVVVDSWLNVAYSDTGDVGQPRTQPTGTTCLSIWHGAVGPLFTTVSAQGTELCTALVSTRVFLAHTGF